MSRRSPIDESSFYIFQAVNERGDEQVGGLAVTHPIELFPWLSYHGAVIFLIHFKAGWRRAKVRVVAQEMGINRDGESQSFALRQPDRRKCDAIRYSLARKEYRFTADTPQI
jgi:hypothetical protein